MFIIGIYPHKGSHTAAVLDEQEPSSASSVSDRGSPATRPGRRRRCGHGLRGRPGGDDLGTGVEPRNLVIDLRGVTFLDSTGLNMLVGFHYKCERNGGSLKVMAPPPEVVRLFEITGLDQILSVVPLS